MSLSDIVSHADLTLYPRIALVLFVAVFLAVVVRTFLRVDRAAAARCAALALDDAPASREPKP